MNRRRILLGCLSLLLTSGLVAAQDELPGDREPLLRLRTEGPTAPVTALAFGYRGDGDARQLVLYAGGYDKIVRTWVRGAKDTFEAGKTYRVPIGPGVEGTLNSLAVSADGRWLATAGISVVREAPGFFQSGFLMPRRGRMKDEMLRDEGTIYVFDTRTDRVRLLRGHRGVIQSLAFAPPRAGKPALLVSVAREEQGEEGVGMLRLWDAEKGGESLAVSPSLPDPGNGRPGLAIWHTGRGLRQLRVAAACDQRPLRIWNIADKERMEKVGDALFINETAAFAAEGDDAAKGTLFSCGTTRDRITRLFARKVDGTAEVEADANRTVVLSDRSLSYSLALLPSRPDGPLDRAALIQCVRSDNVPDNYKYYLLLLDLGQKKSSIKARANVSLWQGGARPALAASPDGRHLAIAGGPDNRVCLFNIKDLLAEKSEPAARFVSAGVRFRNVHFIRQGEARGLLLNEQTDKAHPWRDGLIFDIRQRRMSEERDGWKLDVPDRGDWQVNDPEDAEKKAYGAVVWRGQTRIGAVVLRKDQPWTAWALLPPGTHKVPLLAVAYAERNVPYLGVWNAATGEQVRQFTGHLSIIRGLAFDAAGRRLVSVADDQTVRVWRVDNVEETLGQHGMIHGLALEQPEKGKSLRIAAIERDALNEYNRKALAKVEAGDEVEGLLVSEELRRFQTPHAFYEALWKLKPFAPWQTEVKARPGERAVLRIKGRNIALQVDQGVDEYKPLFSLFVTAKSPRQKDRSWIGWSPEGPYDTNDSAQGGRYIGWHRNTGKTDAPTLFAEADKYHKQFYRDRILHYLLERGEVSKALEDWKKEIQGNRPHIDVWMAGLDPRRLVDRDRPAVARLKELTLQAEVSGIHPARVEKVEWQVFRQGEKGSEALSAPVRFDKTEGVLEVDLLKTKLNLQRGVYEARIAVTLSEAPEQSLSESIWFHYPPPPVITFPAKWIKNTFNAERIPERYVSPKKEFHLEAEVEHDPIVSETQISVWHNGQKVKEGSGRPIDADLTLVRGFNEVEIIAVNKGVSGNVEKDYESHKQRLLLYYDLDALPPQISLRSVTPSEETGARHEWTVGVPHVRIQGEINAGKKLLAATYGRSGEEIQTLKGFKKGADRAFSFAEEIVLKNEDAGKKVEFSFQARTEDGQAESKRIVLIYKPHLPAFRLDSRRIVEASVKEIELLGYLEVPFAPYPYADLDREVFVNGREVKSDLDEKSGRLTMRTALRPGRNPIQIRLHNPYRNVEVKEEIYRRQPPVVSLRSAGEPGPQSADFTAVVEMAPGQTLKKASFARTKIGNQAVSDDTKELAGETWKSVTRGEVVMWTLALKGVLLREGVNTFTLRAVNEDGPGEPSTLLVTGKAVLPSPPTVRFERPPPTKVYEPRCDLSIRVRSTVVPSRPEVKLNGRAVALHRPLEPSRDGRDDYLSTLALSQLKPGPNLVEVKASNRGGTGEPVAINVSYIEPTMAFSPDGYKVRDKTDMLHPLSVACPSGRVELHGSLRWVAGANSAVKRPLPVRVWVNDFEQQCRPELLAADEKGWRFAVPLCLNRPTNRIKLRFPDEVILKEGDSAECVLTCANPEKRQRLHLLIVAPGNRRMDKLQSSVLDAFGAKDVVDDRFRTDAFTGGGRIHGPFRYDDKPREVLGLLLKLREDIRGVRADDFNDVVIMFFQGEMRCDVKKNKRYLLTWAADEKTPVAKREIDCDRIRDTLSGVLGAKLLLLDVKGEKEAAGSIADDAGLIGDLRYIWLGKPDDPARRYLLDNLGPTLSKARSWGSLRKQLSQAPATDPKLYVDAFSPMGYNEIPLKSTKD